ncbi:MAG: hypothetical protein ACRCSB_02870 [Bacteroidales bacterium]
MSNNILFILEGAKTENQIITSLQNHVFASDNLIITCVYGGEIYQIYKEILDDNYLDTFNLVKDRQQNKELLKKYNRNDFAEIYLFFDYEGQSPIADDKKLKLLLDFFNEETDKGKLYISYPMVEAIKHILNAESFQTLKVKCKEKINYKELVCTTSMSKYSNLTKYNKEIWLQIIDLHLKKMNDIVNNKFEFPNKQISQQKIYEKQFERYIRSDSPCVSVLSGIPVFIHDYYGNEATKQMLANKLNTNELSQTSE